MQTITVREAMSSSPTTVPTTMTLHDLEIEFAKTNTHGLLVTEPGPSLYGVVTLQDLARAQEANTPADQTIDTICVRDVLTVTPEQSISEALMLIAQRDLGRLPVVDANNPKRIVGILRRRDIVRAYELALQQKQRVMQEFRNIRLAVYSQARVIEGRVQANSPIAKQPIRGIKWPAGSIIATIRRRGEVIVPSGDTILLPDDVLTIVTTEEHQAELNKMLEPTHTDGKS